MRHSGFAKSAPRNDGLGNNIRCDLVFDEGDAVAQLQFAFLQPLQPQQVRRGRLMQRIDRRVEVAVFLLEASELDRSSRSSSSVMVYVN